MCLLSPWLTLSFILLSLLLKFPESPRRFIVDFESGGKVQFSFYSVKGKSLVPYIFRRDAISAQVSETACLQISIRFCLSFVVKFV